MEWVWIPIAMTAGLCQAVRTAAQKALNAHLSIWMVTYVRSLYGLPFMLVYLWAVDALEGMGTPTMTLLYLSYCLAAAASQVLATYLLILLFQMSNFAVGTILTKTDVMQAALIGSVLFSEQVTIVGWIGILITVLGVLLLSSAKAQGAFTGGWRATLTSRATGVGLATAFLFCLSYLFLREATLVFGQGSALYRGAWSVVVVTSMQVVGLGLYLGPTQRAEFAKLPAVFAQATFIGLTSALGSIGWFTSMAMQNASYVKAVGQTEIIFTILISVYYFRERISARQYSGIAAIVVAVLVFGLEGELRKWLTLT